MKKLLTLSILLVSTIVLAQIDKPDFKKTPGKIANTDLSVVCVPGYSSKVRNVPESLKDKVYDIYNVPKKERGDYKGKQISKIDHLVPLMIGGSNDVSNLWPHYFNVPSGFGVLKKNQIELYLRDQVCGYKMTQQEAFECITKDWIICYRRHIK